MTTATPEPVLDDSAQRFDPYALSPESIEDPPQSLKVALRHIGPGLILAGAIVGTGELIATTNLGAKVGFALLWLVIVSCFIKIFVQVELGRYAISSGKTAIQSFAALPGPGMVLVWWFVLMTLCTQFQLGAMAGGVGQALHLIFPAVSKSLSALPAPIGPFVGETPSYPWAVLTILLTIVLLCRGSYRVVEKGSTLMVVTFTLITVGCVVLLPISGHAVQWNEVVEGLKFSIPKENGALLAALAMFGITGVGASELVAYPYWCIEKGYARKTGPRPAASEASELALRDRSSQEWHGRAKGWLRIMKLDTFVSMIIYTLATLAFYFLGAAVLHTQNPGQGLPSTIGSMLDTLAKMYVPVMGATLALVFIVIGALVVLYSTLFASTAGNARVFTDALWVSRLVSIGSQEDRRRWIRIFCIGMPLLDLLLFTFFGNPVQMVIIGGFAQAVTLPMIAAAAVYLRYRRTDERLRPGMLWDTFLWISFAALCATAAYGLYDVYRKMTA